MKTEKFIDQLELYSNAIVGFVVAQSIAFSFTFGTNATFGCEIARYKWLAAALIAHFLVSTVFAAWVVDFLCRRIIALAKETDTPPSALFEDTLRQVCRGKTLATILFALIPVGLLLFFGLLGDRAHGRCAQPADSMQVSFAIHRFQPYQIPSCKT